MIHKRSDFIFHRGTTGQVLILGAHLLRSVTRQDLKIMEFAAVIIDLWVRSTRVPGPRSSSATD